MKTLYLDCFSGASGDMLLGSLFDLGLNRSKWTKEMSKLGLPEKWKIKFKREERHGICGVHVDIVVPGHKHSQDHDHSHGHGHHHHGDHGHDHDHGHHHHDEQSHSHEHGRSWKEIRRLIEKSKLSLETKKRSLGAFGRLAIAEGKIHGKSPDLVTFHEVGAVDSIVDTIGFCLGLELLGVQRVRCSPLVDGRGFVRAAHGMLPIPVPATLECLKGIPIQQVDEPHELLTPTAACLLAEWAESFLPMSFSAVGKIGYGVGTRHLASRPNVVRALLLEEKQGPLSDQVTVLETQVDDCTGQQIGYLMDLLFKAGALDVFYTGIQMKKNRPGVLITVLSVPEKAPVMADLLFKHTSTFGVRRVEMDRWKLESRFVKGKLDGKAIQFREGWLAGRKIKSLPEYEDLKKAKLL